MSQILRGMKNSSFIIHNSSLKKIYTFLNKYKADGSITYKRFIIPTPSDR
jgi:hypothetical protein